MILTERTEWLVLLLLLLLLLANGLLCLLSSNPKDHAFPTPVAARSPPPVPVMASQIRHLGITRGSISFGCHLRPPSKPHVQPSDALIPVNSNLKCSDQSFSSFFTAPIRRARPDAFVPRTLLCSAGVLSIRCVSFRHFLTKPITILLLFPVYLSLS